MELALVEGLYPSPEGKMVYLRWLWRAVALTHELEDVHAREVFRSDTYDEWYVENLEGGVRRAHKNTRTQSQKSRRRRKLDVRYGTAKGKQHSDRVLGDHTYICRCLPPSPRPLRPMAHQLACPPAQVHVRPGREQARRAGREPRPRRASMQVGTPLFCAPEVSDACIVKTKGV